MTNMFDIEYKETNRFIKDVALLLGKPDDPHHEPVAGSYISTRRKLPEPFRPPAM